QTGDRGAVSYAGLVLDRDDPQRREELLEQIVLLVVERRAPERPDPEGAPDRERPLVRLGRLLPGLGACREHAVGDHLHRLVEPELLPLGGVRPPVLHALLPERARHEALASRALRAEAAARERAVRVALDLGHAAVLDVDELCAA